MHAVYDARCFQERGEMPDGIAARFMMILTLRRRYRSRSRAYNAGA